MPLEVFNTLKLPYFVIESRRPLVVFQARGSITLSVEEAVANDAARLP